MISPSPSNDPLKILLTRPWRIAIMSLLITSFFILAPILVLYTSGFRYNLTTGEFTTTGVISIDTKPQDADIFVNNKYIGSKQPLRLDGLTPGIYEVRVSKTGYHDFKTVLTIRSHETSYIKGVTLWQKTNPTLLQINPDKSVTQVGINSNTPVNYFFVTQSPTSSILHTVSKINDSFVTKNFSTTNTGTHPFNCSLSKNHCVWWSGTEKKIKLISLDDVSNVLSFFAVNNHWQWSGSRTTLGFLETNNGIQSIDRNYLLSPIDHSTSSLWFIDNQGIKVTVPLPSTATAIIDGNDSFALIKTPESIEIISDLKTTATRETVRANNFSHQVSARRWLLWSPWEIESADDTNGHHGILYRSAEPIQQVLGLEPSGSILMVLEKKITAFNPGYFTTQELAQFDHISTVNVDEKSRTIIIAGAKDAVEGIYTLVY